MPECALRTGQTTGQDQPPPTVPYFQADSPSHLPPWNIPTALPARPSRSSNDGLRACQPVNAIAIFLAVGPMQVSALSACISAYLGPRRHRSAESFSSRVFPLPTRPAPCKYPSVIDTRRRPRTPGINPAAVRRRTLSGAGELVDVCSIRSSGRTYFGPPGRIIMPPPRSQPKPPFPCRLCAELGPALDWI